jgi:hypothetical protein
MQITVNNENEDGSADCSVDMSHEEANYLINYAINDLLWKGLDQGKLLAVEEQDDQDTLPVVVKSLKETLITTYMYKWEADEDVVHNLRVRRGCKALLRHYMVPTLAEKYIEQVESIHEGDNDE